MNGILISLDRGATAPLYHQLAQQLRAAIERGEIQPGNFLNGEFALADEWGVSRPTLRRAIDELVMAGLLERRHGVGTRVISNEIGRPSVFSGSFEDIDLDGRKPTTEVTGFARIKIEKETARELEVSSNSEVVRVQRIRKAEGGRIGLLSNLLPLDIAEKMSRKELQNIGLNALLTNAGFAPSTGLQRVGARIATPGETKRLALEYDKTVLTIHRVTRDITGRVIDVGNHVYGAKNYYVEMSINTMEYGNLF